MLDLDETDLIGFFSAEPEPQSEDEREFFDAPLFIKTVKGITLRVSISFVRADLCLDIARTGENELLLQYFLSEIESVRIETDVKGRQWLRVISSSNESVGIAVEPDISIKVEGGQ